MKILAILIGCILAATTAAIAIGMYVLSKRIATALSFWKLPEPDNVVPFSREKRHCDYPQCRCPIDPPLPCPTDWCARSLPKERQS